MRYSKTFDADIISIPLCLYPHLADVQSTGFIPFSGQNNIYIITDDEKVKNNDIFIYYTYIKK